MLFRMGKILSVLLLICICSILSFGSLSESSRKLCQNKPCCNKLGGYGIESEDAIRCSSDQGKVVFTDDCSSIKREDSTCVCCIPSEDDEVHLQGDTTWIWQESINDRISEDIELLEKGAPNSLEYQMYYDYNGVPVSSWHDIPLFVETTNLTFNMIVEIPKWTNNKMEVIKEAALNPIMQDTKDGKLRYVSHMFPYVGYPCNYGALPQTWEDPSHIDEWTGAGGDNDPIDVCEIGSLIAKRGEILQVKVLGVLGLVDEDETDWKLFTINVNDPLASHLNDIEDVERYLPGFLQGALHWFRVYKIPTGKPENTFAFGGNYKGRDFAHQVIMNTYDSWQNLVTGSRDSGSINISSTTLQLSAVKLSSAEAQAIVDAAPDLAPPLTRDPEADVWHFLPQNSGSSLRWLQPPPTVILLLLLFQLI